MYNFFNTQSPASSDELDSLEQYAGINFPDIYRDHLLQHNGGKCLPNIFYFLENGKTTSSCVDWFLATHKEGWGSLKDYIDTYKIDEKRMPSNIMPIAFDPGGNLLCISCSGSDTGAIYFWDHENEIDYDIYDDSDYLNLYFISDNLDKFLFSLTQ